MNVHPTREAHHRGSREIKGDLEYFDGYLWQRLAGPTAGNRLLRSTAAKAFAWGSLVTGDIPDELITSRHLAPTLILESCTAGGSTSSTTETDVTGCTSTFTPAIASVAKVTGIFEMSGDVVADIFGCLLDVDTANETPRGVFTTPVADYRETTTYCWLVALTAASHTLKLQLVRAAGTGVATWTTNSRMLIEVYGDAGATLS